jgi:surface antigen/LysM repeat protein
MGSALDTTAELKQQVFARHQKTARKRRGGPKSTTVAAYVGVFLLIITMVAIGYQPPQKIDSVANAAETQPSTANNASATATDQPSVDQLVATNVAAGIAESADLPIASNVANLSISLAAEHQLAQSDDNVISKPQIIQPTADSRVVKHYISKAGDTAGTVGQKFGISATTVKWANNLATDAISAGKNLVIPPTDGVIYTVKGGDTVSSIATKYKASPDRIVSFNDLELSGAKAGRTIIVPGGILPVNERPGYVSPSEAASMGAYDGGYATIDAQMAGASAGNRYAYGNCTWYAYERRVQLGLPVGSFWGNAATWAMYARAAGYRVDNTPSVGAIAQWNAYQGGSYYAGHVGIVESVNSDGSITISEMNYLYNFNRVTSRTISPSSVSNFIH